MIRFHYLPEVTFNKRRFLMFRVNTHDGSMETFFQVHWQAWNPRSKPLFWCEFSGPRKPFSSVRMHRNDAATKHNLNISQPLSATSQCLKITEKVAFITTSEASYVYILSGQKFTKNAKYGQFWRFFETLSLRSNSVTRHVTFNRTKIGGKCQNWKN